MTVNRLFLLVYAAVFLALSVFAGVFFYRTYGELLNLKKQEVENRRRLAETEIRLAEQRDVLERLERDPAFVERMIRDRLGYARPDEIVFRFDK
jgi:cell division protein FtsB